LSAVVLETNVLAVANETATQAGPGCVLACLAALDSAKESRVVVVDSAGRIFEEYSRHATRAGQPGAGDAFFKWLWDHQGYSDRCEMVDLTPIGQGQDEFAEFPRDPSLKGFDPADKKFVAVAIASPRRPQVVNAVDTDWWHYRAALARNGVTVQFLCSELMR
jgi:hypothetical protein